MKLGMEVSCPFWRHRRVMRKILTQNFIENFRESLRANSVKTGATALVQGCRGVAAVAELCGSRGFLDGHALHDASNNFDARKNKSCVLYLRAKERLSWKTRDKSPGTLEVWRAGAAANAKIASGSIGIFNGVFTLGGPIMRLLIVGVGISLLVMAAIIAPRLLQAGGV